MTIYYYEKTNGSGHYEAQDDEEALMRLPECLVLYRESQNTPDGRPFVIVYERDEDEYVPRLNPSIVPAGRLPARHSRPLR